MKLGKCPMYVQQWNITWGEEKSQIWSFRKRKTKSVGSDKQCPLFMDQFIWHCKGKSRWHLGYLPCYFSLLSRSTDEPDLSFTQQELHLFPIWPCFWLCPFPVYECDCSWSRMKPDCISSWTEFTSFRSSVTWSQKILFICFIPFSYLWTAKGCSKSLHLGFSVGCPNTLVATDQDYVET